MINVAVFSGFAAWRHGPVREKQSYQRIQQEIPILVATDVAGKKQSCEKKNCFSAEWLKGRSQLAHMRNRYHFIANFHITERK